MKKTALVWSLALCIAAGSVPAYATPAAQAPSIPTYAQEALFSPEGAITYHELNGEVLIPGGAQARIMQPRFAYIDAISARLVHTNGYATCTSTAFVDSGYTYKLVSTLNRSTDGKSWRNIKSWSTSVDYESSIDLENHYYLTAGYQYQLDTTVTVYSGSRVIEVVTRSSNVVHY